MAAVLSTNMASLYAQKNLSTAQTALSASVQRLSSGTRINSAKDDAAGYGISESLKGTKNIVDQNIRNAKDGISYAQVAEGALDVVGKILQRSLTLVTQSQDQTLNADQQASIHTELLALREEIVNINLRTKFQGGGNELSVFGANGIGGSDMVSLDTSGNDVNGLNSPILRVDASGNASAQGQYYLIDPARLGSDSSKWHLNNISDPTQGGYFEENNHYGPGTHEVSVTGASFITTPVLNSYRISSFNSTITVTGVVDGSDQKSILEADGYWTNNGNGNYSTTLLNFGTNHGTFNPANYTPIGGLQDGDLEVMFGNNIIDIYALFTMDHSSFTTSPDASEITGLNDPILGTDLNQALPTLSSSIYVDTGSSSSTEVNATMIDINTLFVSDDPDVMLSTLQDLITENATNRSTLGSAINSLEYAVDNMQTLSTNLADGISRIVDTDYAAETSNLTRTQILQQAATSMLAQANQMPNVILTLLK